MKIELAETEILVDRGLPEPLLSRRRRGGTVIVGQPAARHVTDRVVERLGDAPLLQVQGGETDKTLAGLEQVYAHLDSHAVRRDGTLVGVGGGSLTDLVGFAAATWLRGIEAVYVPTTLLGAVDAAIGGKTGINFRGKNLVGSFWHPSRVVIDLDVLAELPSEIAREGWAEIIKAGLLNDPSLVASISQDGTSTDLERAVTAAIQYKAEVVSEDFREAGRRAELNFGHTIGHAIETSAGVSHGVAVGLGLIAEAAASAVDCGFTQQDLVHRAVAAVGLPTRAPELPRNELTALMSKDKKADAEGLRMVMLESVGKPVLLRPSRGAIEAAWTAIGL